MTEAQFQALLRSPDIEPRSAWDGDEMHSLTRCDRAQMGTIIAFCIAAWVGVIWAVVSWH